VEAPTVAELLNLDYHLEPVIAGGMLVQESSMLVVGPTEVGKSYFVLQMALELATGQPFLGQWKVTRPFKVLLVQAEVGKSRFQDRVRKFAGPYPKTGDMLRLATQYTLKLDEPDGHAALWEVLTEHGIEVLILDPMRPFHSGDENSSRDMERFYHGLRLYQQDSSLAVVITHHERKPVMGFSSGDKYAARGSGLITDRPDTVLRLEPNKDPNLVTMTVEKLRNADESEKPGPFKLEKSRTGLFVVAGAQGARTAREREIAEIVGEGLPYEQFRREVQERYSVAERTAKRWTDELEEEGVIRRKNDPEKRGRKVILMGKET